MSNVHKATIFRSDSKESRVSTQTEKSWAVCRNIGKNVAIKHYSIGLDTALAIYYT